MKTNTMRSVKSLLVVLMLAASAATAFAADLSGTWKVDGSVSSNSVNYACTLKQDGDRLTGTATLEGKDHPVTGTVTGKAVTWKFTVDYNGTPLEITFDGTRDSDTDITGKIDVMGYGGEFRAKRQ